jgi:hypothetical protein
MREGKADILLSSRETPFPESSKSGPIYICTRNDDLDAIILKTPADRREDLVFLQNGMLTPYLEEKGLITNTAGKVTFQTIFLRTMNKSALCFTSFDIKQTSIY